MIVLSPIQSIAISPERSYDEGMNDLKTLLNHLPYKLAAYDAQGNFLYDNDGADGSFFPREPENLPDWIMSEVLASPTKERSYQIPTDSFDQILIQTYQAAIDNEGKVLGFWETIYDLKQPLKTYLDNSAQALVAWSDTTSGASFKEETDFDAKFLAVINEKFT